MRIVVSMRRKNVASESQSPIHPLEDDIECGDQHHIGRKNQQIAGNAESK